MNKVIWILLALLSGAFLPIQAGLNTKLGKAGGSAVHASMLSFAVGTLALVLYLLLTKQAVSWSGLRAAPPVVWLGGLLGAFYVTVIILAYPRLGPGLTFGLVVAGQMLVSLLLEHYNVLVAEQHPISPMRVVGILLVVAGVVVLRRF